MTNHSKQIAYALTDARELVLVPHANPDGDALGSVAALASFLTTLGKPFTIFCKTPMPERYRYLPYVGNMVTDPAFWRTSRADVVIVCDSGDLAYAGVDTMIPTMKQVPILINIDHHATNQGYGNLTLVDVGASSTSEVLYRFFRDNRITITPEIATALLTGLMYDTDNFTNGATSPQALAIGSDLMKRGGQMGAVQHFVFRNKTMATLKLWGIAFSRLAKHTETRIAFTYITRADLLASKAADSDVEGIANFLNNVHTEDAIASLILKEQNDQVWKGSFRTTRSDTDVAALAKALGGGGHKKAAGFAVTGSLDAALSNVWNTITKHLPPPTTL